MDTKAISLDPALLQLVTEMNLFGDRLLVQRGRADHEAATFWEDHHGKLGRRDRTFRRWRVCPLRGSEGSYRPLHEISGAGSRAVRDHGELHSPRRDRHRADHGNGHPRKRSEQS